MLGWIKATSFAKQDEEEREKIDAVLFSIWARGYPKKPLISAAMTVVFSAVVGAVLWIVYLPSNIAKFLPEVLFSMVLAYLLVAALELGYQSNFVAMIFAILLVTLRHPVLAVIRHLLFDIFDVMFLGSLTRRYIEWWESLGPLKQLEDREFCIWLFTSRQLLSGEEQDELDAALAMFSDAEGSKTDRMSAIEGYWNTYPSDVTFWRDLLAQRRR